MTVRVVIRICCRVLFRVLWEVVTGECAVAIANQQFTLQYIISLIISHVNIGPAHISQPYNLLTCSLLTPISILWSFLPCACHGRRGQQKAGRLLLSYYGRVYGF